MIAYNRTGLNNLWVQQEAGKEYDEGCISKEEIEGITNNYPVSFYMPNPFVRIGLFVLTVIIASFSLGLLSLLFLSGGFESFGGLSIFFGLITYGALEFMVSTNHYKSGVDDALLWMSAAFIIGGLNVAITISPLGNALIIFFLAVSFSLRFSDMLMCVAACLSLLAIVFYTYIRFGPVAKATMPFLIMIICGLIYFFVKTQLQKEKWRYYTNCFIMVEITTLACFFIAGNYFVVREASIAMFNLDLKEAEGIPLGWLFWILTVTIPLLYMYRGIQKKDAVLLRTGLFLVAAMIFTIRYYYHFVSVEIAMVTGGSIMIAIAYALIKYLHEPKYGFTYHEQTGKLFIDKLQVETLLIAETFTGSTQPADSGTRFGGGSGGGGGASGDF